MASLILKDTNNLFVLEEAQIIDDFQLSFQLKDYSIPFESGSVNSIAYQLSFISEYSKNQLGYVFDINSVSGSKFRCSALPATLSTQSQCFEGLFYFEKDETEVKGSSICTKVYGTFQTGIINCLELLPENLCELNLGTTVWDRETIESIIADESPYDGTNNIWYPLEYRGAFKAGFVQVEDMYPAVYDAAIIDAIEKQIQKPIVSNLFRSEAFRRRLRPFVSEDCILPVDQTDLDFFSFKMTLVNPLVVDINNTVLNPSDGNWFVEDPSGMITSTGATPHFTVPKTAKWVMGVNVQTGEDVTGEVFTIQFQFLNTDNYIFELSGFNTIASQTVEKDQGDQFHLFSGVLAAQSFTLLAGSEITFSLSPEATEGAKISIGQSLPCELITDYLADLQTQYNLIFAYDPLSNTMLVDPKDDIFIESTGETIAGFNYGVTNHEDWSNGEIFPIEKEEKEYKVADINRTIIFEHCEDNNDEYISGNYLSKRVNMCTNLPKGETSISTKLTAATQDGLIPESVRGAPATTIPRVPYYVSYEIGVDDPVKSCDFKWRVLHKVGNIAGHWMAFEDLNELTTYPYATFYDPSRKINLGFETRNGVTGLVDIAYLQDIDIWNAGVRVKIKTLIDLNYIANFITTFRRPKFLKLPSGSQGYFQLENINELIVESGDKCDGLVEMSFISLSNNKVDIKEIEITPPLDCDPVVSFDFSLDTQGCLIVTALDSNGIPATGTLEWRNGTTWLPYTGPLCRCEFYDSLEADFECSELGDNICYEINNINSCEGDGAQLVITFSTGLVFAAGFVTEFSNCISVLNWNTFSPFTINLSKVTPLGLLELGAIFAYTGGPFDPEDCTSITIVAGEPTRLYYDIDVRFTNACIDGFVEETYIHTP